MGKKKRRSSRPKCPDCASIVLDLISVRHKWKADAADTDRAEVTIRKWKCRKCGSEFEVAEPL
jgi:hypothetical protein